MRPARMRPNPPPAVVFAALGALLAATGCGTAPPTTPDAGEQDPEVVLTPVVPIGLRRGPIQLAVTIENAPAGAAASLERSAAGQFVPATLVPPGPGADAQHVVWDSFADAPFDGPVALRWKLVAGARTVLAPFSLEVRNAPDTDRLVIVGHPLLDDGAGGATPDNDEVSVVVWSGLAPSTVGTPRRLQVGAGPKILRAAPHGRATAIVNDADNTITLVSTSLLALAAEVAEITTFSLPHGVPADVQWSPDGRFLYVAGGLENDPPQPPVLWRFAPSEDLSTWPDPVALAELPGPPSGLAVAPDGRILVACGSGGAGQSKVALFGVDGSTLGTVFGDFGPANGLAFSPDGQDALLVSAGFEGDRSRASPPATRSRSSGRSSARCARRAVSCSIPPRRRRSHSSRTWRRTRSRR